MPRRLNFLSLLVYLTAMVLEAVAAAQPAATVPPPAGSVLENRPAEARFRHRFTIAEIGGKAPVWSVAPGREGRAWAATAGGLHEFDGQSWRSVAGLDEGPIQAVAVDAAGRVWYVGVEQFGWVEAAASGGHVARPLRVPDLAARPEAAGGLWRRIVFLDGETYILFGGRRLVVRVDAAGGVHAIPLEEPGRTLHVWEGGAYVQTLQKGWRIAGDRAVEVPAETPLWRGYTVRAVLAHWPREAGDLWIVGSKAIRRWNRANDTFLNTGEIAQLLGGDFIFDGAPLGRDRVALATRTLGVIVAELTGKVLERIDAASGLGPGGNTIYDLAAAEDESLWIAHAGGVACVPLERVAPVPVAREESPARASAPLSPRYSGLPLMRVFTENETGLSSHNWDVLRHPNGLLYAANTSGLLEFDGVTWRTIPGPGGICFRLAADGQGRVFFGGEGGFGSLVADAEGRLRKQWLSDKLPGDQSVGHWRSILPVGDDVYFLSLDRRALVRVDAQGALRLMDAPAAAGTLIAWEGRVYLTGSPTIYRVAGDRVEAVSNPPAVLRSATRGAVRSIWPGEDGAAWVITSSGGPWRVTREGQWSSPGEVARVLGGDLVMAGRPLPDGTFALATRAHGLLRVDREQRVLARYDEDRGLGLASGTVNALAEDDEGGLWAAHAGGITRIQVGGPGAIHGTTTGVRGPARALALHRDLLYVATRQGLFERDPLTGIFSPVPGVGTELASLCSLDEGLLVAGSRLMLRRDSGGLEEVDGSSAAHDRIMRPPNDPDRIVSATSQGIRVYRRIAGRWALEGTVQQARERYSRTRIDGAGFLWMQRASGKLVRLDWRKGVRLDAPVEEIGVAHGLAPGKEGGRENFAVHDQGLWLAREGELLRHDPAEDRFAAETRIAGLAAADVTPGFFTLDDGALWLTRTTGARRSGLAQPTGSGGWKMAWEPYTGFESVPTAIVLLDASNRTVWIGSGQAAAPLVSYDLATDRPQAAPPSVRVRRVETEKLTLWGGAGPAPHAPLPPDRTSLKFSFAAPTFRADTLGRVEVNYRTQLVGFDHEWSRWSVDATRIYTNLPPGSFTFRMQARGDDYREGPEATFVFRILPPWWRTWWFLGLAGISCVGGVAGVARWLGNRALRRQLERVEAQSAVERERLRLARDLHDEIGSGLGRVVLFAGEARRGKADPAKLDAALDRVRDSAQELMQHAREIVWAVNPQHDTLASVIERVGDYVEDTLGAAGIACRVELPAPVPAAAALGSDARHSLFLAVKEAVHNCVKYSGATSAECRLEITGGHLVIVLRDHGRGFAAGELRGTGHGLPNISARLEALGGSGVVTSEPGQGATVTLRVPLGKGPA
jgi:signal transduction histidine kinase